MKVILDFDNKIITEKDIIDSFEKNEKKRERFTKIQKYNDNQYRNKSKINAQQFDLPDDP